MSRLYLTFQDDVDFWTSFVRNITVIAALTLTLHLFSLVLRKCCCNVTVKHITNVNSIFIYCLDFIMVNIIRKINSTWKNVFFDQYAKYTFTQKHIMMLWSQTKVIEQFKVQPQSTNHQISRWCVFLLYSNFRCFDDVLRKSLDIKYQTIKYKVQNWSTYYQISRSRVLLFLINWSIKVMVKIHL